MKRKIYYILLGIVIALTVGFLVFFTWSQQTYKPSQELYTLISKQDIKYEKDWIIFNPNVNNKVGIVLYPGAKVEPEAYSYYGKQLSKQGYLVAIPNVNFNFALFDTNKAQEIIDSYASVQKWVVGGHSLGGVTASKFAYIHSEEIDGVILLGSYPNESTNFSKTNLPMLSIYAEKDGLSTINKIQETKDLLSKKTTMYEIKGGNHGQFGIYGIQEGDNKASIPVKKQQDEMINITSTWMKENSY
ncbi:alpha/beta fold hydrolase [Priestia megaterium]|uniref:alpha/beta fold hydrolase n=1 Tax=Priestia megaterium TaxID=1404 RepID=UPI0027315965|nr:alpha/beta fold hydrolase [Priestia megaterium]MDP1442113.1 alpha/beta hydrolase [Priestia megaterium]MDP1471110.1 alpha/beta hydrolase [Priestia megaterium]